MGYEYAREALDDYAITFEPTGALAALTNTQGKPDTALYIAFAGRKHACPCMYFSACGGG